MNYTAIFYWSLAVTAMGLVLTGIWGVLTRRNVLRIALAFTLADTGVNLLLVWTGFLPGRGAPIMDGTVSSVVDPLPQALVLTSIVIGVAVAALFVVVGVLASRKSGSADVRRMKELKW
ncbi:MAG TPA: cation:proton antiporter subunit C [Candidatus Sabulitectum sp.]|nr:cation:proton antiporter subunit C [Candidatus Sabulitectum sp.]HRW78808.1 cation:proton antiporter subunit C [Candidatus Sabulitectum sp.]